MDLFQNQGAKLSNPGRLGRISEKIEYYKASVRARVEHPFHIIKNLLGLKKVRYRVLAKNTARLHTLFGLANLMIAGRRLGAQQSRMRLERTKTEATWPFTGPLRTFRHKNQSIFTESTISGNFMPIYVGNKIVHVVRSPFP